MTGFPIVTRRDDLERACAFLAASQAPQLPLWRAAADGRINIVWIADLSRPWPGGVVKRSTRPIVACVGADMDIGGPDPRPTDWLCARRLRDWCACAIVHGSGGQPRHYREAVRAAELTGRCAVVETTSLRVREWAEYLSPRRTLVIVPREGVHPITTAREAMH
jgi:hypothetical protein